MEFLELLVRSFFFFIVLLIITKLMGYRQISQLSFYDYIIGISIGSISADMAVGLDDDWWHTFVPLVIYGISSLLLSRWTMKSVKARRFLSGTPVILIENGELLKQNLNKVHYDLSDFLTACRSAGYFDINDIQYAIMEHTGTISFLPYPNKRNCTPEDFQLNPQPEGLVCNLIIDGKIMKHHLKRIGKDLNWLNKQLDQQNIAGASEVLLATYDVNGQFQVFRQKTTKESFSVLD